jgi:hypothetical protein
MRPAASFGIHEGVTNPAIAAWIVLHQIAGQEDAVRPLIAPVGVGNCRLQCRQRRDAAQASGAVAE